MTTENGEQLLEQISRNIYLVSLKCSWPKFHYKIADAVVEVDTNNGVKVVAEEFRNNPAWTLMPKGWHDTFTNLEGRARRIMSNSALSFATKGMAMLPISKAPAVFTEFRQLRYELYAKRDEFCNEYKDILDRLKSRLGTELYNKAARKLPSTTTVRNNFELTWAIMPIGGSGTRLDVEALEQVRRSLTNALDASGIDATGVEDALNYVNSLIHTARNPLHTIDDETATELVQEARDQMRQYTEKMLNDMAQEPRQEVANAVDNMLESIRLGRTIRTGTIGQISRAFEMVRGFSFLADRELLNRIKECEHALDGVTPTELNKDEVLGSRIAAVLKNVRDQAMNPEAVDTTVRKFRNIRIIRPQQTEPVTA